jgi:hypothetical protein
MAADGAWNDRPSPNWFRVSSVKALSDYLPSCCSFSMCACTPCQKITASRR